MAERALLIYDGECPMCQRARDWVERHVPREKLDIIACQDEDRPRRAPMVSRQDCMEAMQLVFPDGRCLAAEKAFPPLLRMTPWGRYIAWAFYLPGVPWLYQQVARNRMAISALLDRKESGEHCSIDEGCE